MSPAATPGRSLRARGVLAVLAVLLVAALTACHGGATVTSAGRGTTTTTTAGRGTTTTSSTALAGPTTSTTVSGIKTGGLLTVGAGVATSPDPLTASTPTDDFLVAQVFEQLTTITADGQVAPLLATDWSSSSGGIVWVFDLRSGVRFHDGRPLEAADVVATFESLTSATAPPDVRARFGGIVSVIALDPTRVEFILRTPDPTFSRVVADARAYETVTSMGTRRLRWWLNYPLVDPEKIRERLEAVSEMKERHILRGDLRNALSRVYDLERLASRVSMGVANGRDLIALMTSLKALPQIRAFICGLDASLLASIYAGIDEMPDICSMIERAIVEDPPMTIREGRSHQRGL